MPSIFSVSPTLAASRLRRSTSIDLIVGLERHRKRMAVLAAERERESRRIGEARRRAVDHFRDHRQRLQRARTDVLEQQQRREVAQLAGRATPPARRRAASGRHPWRARRDGSASASSSLRSACAADCRWRSPAAHPARASRAHRRGSESAPCRCSPDDAGVRLAGEVLHRRGVPVIAARQPRAFVHALLHDRPLAGPASG